MTSSRKVGSVIVFTDAATSSKFKVSVGVYLYLDQQCLNLYSTCTDEDLSRKLSNHIVYTTYESKKSTWSEIKTVIDALHAVLKKSGPNLKVEIYTDCKSLCDLLNRRKEKLEKNNFITKSGKALENANLYKELFAIVDKFQIKIFKIKGHHSAAHRLTLYEKIFAMIDKLSRKKLRSMVNNVVD